MYIMKSFKSLKLFSPFSFVFLIVALFIMFGAGCLDVEELAPPSKLSVSGVPMLDIIAPELVTSTSANKIQITGSTDQKQVFINKMPFDVLDGVFSALVVLESGEHNIPVSVGNGLTTTTISLLITRE